jgi:murein DD-endopeptidase MepM/ murein hydrolase activator NlpD
MKIFLFTLLFCITACTVSKNPLRKEIKLLQKGIIRDDTSYVYVLPYEENTSHLLIQGYFGAFTHHERAALDFKMKRGTKILAARGGVVARVKQDGKRGGANRKYRAEGNYIVIQHADSSRAGYWHLQKDGALVKIGDKVRKGQVIGYSGKTGYTAFPHLHFLVWGFNKNDRWHQLPTRFQTSKGIKYLKAINRYRSTNKIDSVGYF